MIRGDEPLQMLASTLTFMRWNTLGKIHPHLQLQTTKLISATNDYVRPRKHIKVTIHTWPPSGTSFRTKVNAKRDTNIGSHILSDDKNLMHSAIKHRVESSVGSSKIRLAIPEPFTWGRGFISNFLWRLTSGHRRFTVILNTTTTRREKLSS